ncbi:MAG: methyltransferase [Desulfuromonadaceae bacterium]|nr:methyltransferase [Desulfuromonadaceae bacterium]MDD2855892.1 methyltransferase [Desulfuromonadaceae bacterium]
MITPNKIIKMASAFYDSCLLFTASDLGVFAKLAEYGSADAKTLAGALQVDLRGIRLLLDACVALDLLIKDGDFYKNTAEAALFLVPGSPADLSGAIKYNRDVYPAWGELKSFVESGRPVEKPEEHLGLNSERTRTFVMSMHYRALAIGRAVVGELDLAGCKKLLDVGGGPGTYSVLISQKYSEIQCTVMDLPDIVAIADGLIAQQGCQERVKTLGGDYRTAPFPDGNDVVNFFGMFHQESPESILALLKKAYNSLNPGGVVNIMDMMTDHTHTKPLFSALFAVNMALTTDNGWVFSDTELLRWLNEAGFTDCLVKPLPPPMPHTFASARKL